MDTHIQEEKIERILTEFVEGFSSSDFSQFLIDHFQGLGVEPEQL